MNTKSNFLQKKDTFFLGVDIQKSVLERTLVKLEALQRQLDGRNDEAGLVPWPSAHCRP